MYASGFCLLTLPLNIMYGSPVALRFCSNLPHLRRASTSPSSSLRINLSPTTAHWCRFKHWRFTSPLGSRISNQSSKSLCSMFRLLDAAPRRTLPCDVARIVESNILVNGMTPSDVPFLDIFDPAGRMRLKPTPTPPPCLASSIISKFLVPMS